MKWTNRILIPVALILLLVDLSLLTWGAYQTKVLARPEVGAGGTPRPPTPTSSLTPEFVEETGTPEPLPTNTPRPPTPTSTPRPPTPTPAVYDPCACDWDFDGDIDIVDIQALAAQWGTVGCDDSPVLWYGTPEF